MDLGLDGRVAFVSGGSRGIGRACALAFAREGARVAFSYRGDREQAEATAEAVAAAGGEPLPVVLDLEQVATMAAAVDRITERWGGIDVFAGCAVGAMEGFTSRTVQWSRTPGGRAFEDVPPAEWQRMLRTNLDGVMASLQAVLPAMRGRPAGRIVLVSSHIARRGFQGGAAYGAAKAALGGIVASLVAELGGEILVNLVMPGLTSTEGNSERTERLRTVAEETPSRRLSTPEDIARAVVFLGSPANGNINGETVKITGGL